MRGSERATFRPTSRLRQAGAFGRVFRDGRRVDGPLFVLVVARSRHRIPRLGLAAGRKLGAACHRNRAKRLLREAFRRNRELVPYPADLVLIAKPGLADDRLETVEREYRRRLARL